MPEKLRPLLESAVQDRIVLADQAATTFWRKTEAPPNVTLEDIKAAAYYGLMLAAHRYDAYCEERGFDSNDLSYFSVYCRKRIYGEMIEYLRDQDWLTRAARTRQKMLDGLQEGEESVLSDEDLAEKTGLTVAQIRKVKVAADQAPISLTLEDGFELDPVAAYVDDEVTTNLLLEVMADVLSLMSYDERLLLAHRYYLQKTILATAEDVHMASADTARSLHSILMKVRYAVLDSMDLE